MKQVILHIADSKFNTFLEFIKTLEYVKVENDEGKALLELQSSLRQVKLMQGENYLNNLLLTSSMNSGYNVIPTPDFKKLFKKLAKKYPSLKNDLHQLITTLQETPDIGTPLGHGIYKIRMAIASKGKGKSGGDRVITFLVTEDQEVYLTYIYDKNQLENLTKDQILKVLKKAGLI